MKGLLLLFTGIFLISFISASPGVYKQGEPISLTQTCADCTYINITSITAPNGTQIVGQVEMTKDGSVFNYTLDSFLTTSLGTYSINGMGNPLGVNDVWRYGIEVTYNGTEISTAQATLYGILFFVFIFFMVSFIFIINTLPSDNTKDEEGRLLSISYLKYLRSAFWFFEWMLLIGLLYLSSNLAFAFLNEQMFAGVLFTLFKVLFGMTPLIVVVWVIWIFAKMFHDRQFQNILNRGMFPQGRL